jgi:hypothetical protein
VRGRVRSASGKDYFVVVEVVSAFTGVTVFFALCAFIGRLSAFTAPLLEASVEADAATGVAVVLSVALATGALIAADVLLSAFMAGAGADGVTVVELDAAGAVTVAGA